MILVIDDTTVSADAIARTLRETGREVLCASTVPVAAIDNLTLRLTA